MSAQQCHEQAAEHGGARSLSDQGSDSNAKRISLAALRHAARSYGSIFGQKPELAVCNALAQAESSSARPISELLFSVRLRLRHTALP